MALKTAQKNSGAGARRFCLSILILPFLTACGIVDYYGGSERRVALAPAPPPFDPSAFPTEVEVTGSAMRPEPIDIAAMRRTRESSNSLKNESYSPGWKATVNGESSSLFRAEVDYMACAIPLGQSRVQFRFEPDSVTAGFRISVGSLWFLCLGSAVFYFLKFRGFRQRKPNMGRMSEH